MGKKREWRTVECTYYDDRLSQEKVWYQLQYLWLSFLSFKWWVSVTKEVCGESGAYHIPVEFSSPEEAKMYIYKYENLGLRPQFVRKVEVKDP